MMLYLQNMRSKMNNPKLNTAIKNAQRFLRPPCDDMQARIDQLNLASKLIQDYVLFSIHADSVDLALKLADLTLELKARSENLEREQRLNDLAN